MLYNWVMCMRVHAPLSEENSREIPEYSKISITTMPSTSAPSSSSSNFVQYKHIQESSLFCGRDNNIHVFKNISHRAHLRFLS